MYNEIYFLELKRISHPTKPFGTLKILSRILSSNTMEGDP